MVTIPFSVISWHVFGLLLFFSMLQIEIIVFDVLESKKELKIKYLFFFIFSKKVVLL